MSYYGFKVVYVDSRLLADAGFASVAGLPFIFDPAPGYARLPCQYLIDRGLGLWDPKSRGKTRNPLPPSRVSMRNFAHWLANALEWADVRGLDLLASDYSSVLIGRYQKEMLSGIWSANNEPLSAKTVNVRVQTALEFQMWAADKGLREPLSVTQTTSLYTANSSPHGKAHLSVEAHSRKGKVKVNKRTLVFPKRDAIRAWRALVGDAPISGLTDGLIVDLILETAIRREEAACWRVDTLPLNRTDWMIVNPEDDDEFQRVLVSIKYGAKGREYGIDEHGDKIGPQATIQVPLRIAERIHSYRQHERLSALKQRMRKARSLEAQRRIQRQAVHLFLHPVSGKRYTGAQIYSLWTRHTGPAHWSPHMGRDWWACCHLERRMQQHADLLQQVLNLPRSMVDSPLLLALRDTAQTVIQLEIKPQLRHANLSTTETYLEWYFSQLRFPRSSIRALLEIEGEQARI